ncbi:sodium:calcium antiporter [Stenotrophomonas rhizophila]|uniref:sodium:calcium antiporter n=1 Tax=Stenotrophomonas rhizophila TaxID=216778 RepID=UPI001E5B4622|nr:sodium:calcium antiporter [Stenotrophomonas rhizophila]MCC7634222.1 sodium:calcium antiporter [Stenotrophomonas rhizophila]MCC7665311.1 sodium:calcium antiporter [Stenotrophomonas rhizophila]
MIAATAWFVLGLLLLALGGDSIVKAASGLAQRVGASPFVAGLLLVAFGTSLPELVVNARAFVVGAGELALGNAVGSNIVNLGLTLGMAALAAPLLVRMRLLSPLLVMLAVASLALIAFGLDGVIARWEGGVLLLGFVLMLGYVLCRARREAETVQEAVAGYAMTRTGLFLNVVRLLFAAVALYYGARWIVQAAPQLGAGLGWSPLLVGLLPVAIGTALPEVAAAIAAARRGQGDMVLGHVIGSSLFNLLVVVGGMAALRPMALPASFVKLELPAAVAFVLVLYPMLKGDLTISRREGGILLVAFLAWIALELALIG